MPPSWFVEPARPVARLREDEEKRRRPLATYERGPRFCRPKRGELPSKSQKRPERRVAGARSGRGRPRGESRSPARKRTRAGSSRAGSSRSNGEKQLTFGFPTPRDGTRRGGARRGAGRKRQGVRQCTPHRSRPRHRQSEPVHVTLRAALSPLRSQFVFPTVRLAISRATRRAPDRFRIVEFSVQRDHVHLIVEAANKRELSAGVRSVSIRIARYVNDLLMRRGRLWADRWHGRALRSPREVRHALGYVLTNFRKHARHGAGIDPYSSGAWFEGWREWHPSSDSAAPFAARPPPGVAVEPRGVPRHEDRREELNWRPALRARSWLSMIGWRRAGLLGLADSPAPTKD